MGDKSPSQVCTDPCFQPFMTAMLNYMTTAASSECAAAFGFDGSGRRLLGGNTAPTAAETAKLEKTIGSLCVKNAAGTYCVDAFSAMDTASSSSNSNGSPLDAACASACSYTSGGSTTKCSTSNCPICEENVYSSDCKTCALGVNAACGACVDCYKNNTNTCPLTETEKTSLSSMGCCYGTGFMLAALYDTSSSSTTSSKMSAAALNKMVTACGITGLTATPC